MNYEINPCKACWEKYKNSDCNINTINNCVTETAAAFAGFPNNNIITNTPAEKNWQECIHKMMKAQGRDPCEFQLDMAPVFNQVPHYFPDILSTTQNPDKALQYCVEKCSTNKMYKNTCVENCKTDYSALQTISNKELSKKNKLDKKYNNYIKLDNTNSKQKKITDSPVFWFTIGIIIINIIAGTFYYLVFRA